jgi:hypothetical protein
MSATRLVFGLGVAALGAIVLSLSPHRDPRPMTAAPAKGSAEFHPQDDLPALLFVKALDGGKAAAAYEAQARDSDGARRDALTLGDPSSEGPFLRASARIGAISTRSSLFFVELAREAAEVGQAVAHASTPQAEADGGGAVLLSDVTLEADGHQRACLGFHFNAVGAAVLSGVACGAVGAPLERAALTCLIGRLEASPAGAAAGFGKILSAASREQSSC